MNGESPKGRIDSPSISDRSNLQHSNFQGEKNRQQVPPWQQQLPLTSLSKTRENSNIIPPPPPPLPFHHQGTSHHSTTTQVRSSYLPHPLNVFENTSTQISSQPRYESSHLTTQQQQQFLHSPTTRGQLITAAATPTQHYPTVTTPGGVNPQSLRAQQLQLLHLQQLEQLHLQRQLLLQNARTNNARRLDLPQTNAQVSQITPTTTITTPTTTTCQAIPSSQSDPSYSSYDMTHDITTQQQLQLLQAYHFNLTRQQQMANSNSRVPTLPTAVTQESNKAIGQQDPNATRITHHSSPTTKEPVQNTTSDHEKLKFEQLLANLMATKPEIPLDTAGNGSGKSRFLDDSGNFVFNMSPNMTPRTFSTDLKSNQRKVRDASMNNAATTTTTKTTIDMTNRMNSPSGVAKTNESGSQVDTKVSVPLNRNGIGSSNNSELASSVRDLFAAAAQCGGFLGTDWKDKNALATTSVHNVFAKIPSRQPSNRSHHSGRSLVGSRERGHKLQQWQPSNDDCTLQGVCIEDDYVGISPSRFKQGNVCRETRGKPRLRGGEETSYREERKRLPKGWEESGRWPRHLRSPRLESSRDGRYGKASRWSSKEDRYDDYPVRRNQRDGSLSSRSDSRRGEKGRGRGKRKGERRGSSEDSFHRALRDNRHDRYEMLVGKHQDDRGPRDYESETHSLRKAKNRSPSVKNDRGKDRIGENEIVGKNRRGSKYEELARFSGSKKRGANDEWPHPKDLVKPVTACNNRRESERDVNIWDERLRIKRDDDDRATTIKRAERAKPEWNRTERDAKPEWNRRPDRELKSSDWDGRDYITDLSSTGAIYKRPPPLMPGARLMSDSRRPRSYRLVICMPINLSFGKLKVTKTNGENFYVFSDESANHASAKLLFSANEGVCDAWASFLQIKLGQITNVKGNEIPRIVAIFHAVMRSRLPESHSVDSLMFSTPLRLKCVGLHVASEESGEASEASRLLQPGGTGVWQVKQKMSIDPKQETKLETRGYLIDDAAQQHYRALCVQLKRFAAALGTETNLCPEERLEEKELEKIMNEHSDVLSSENNDIGKSAFAGNDKLSDEPKISNLNHENTTEIGQLGFNELKDGNKLSAIKAFPNGTSSSNSTKPSVSNINVFLSKFVIDEAVAFTEGLPILVNEYGDVKNKELENSFMNDESFANANAVDGVEVSEIRLAHESKKMVDPRFAHNLVLTRQMAGDEDPQRWHDVSKLQQKHEDATVVSSSGGNGDDEDDSNRDSVLIDQSENVVIGEQPLNALTLRIGRYVFCPNALIPKVEVSYSDAKNCLSSRHGFIYKRHIQQLKTNH